MKKTAILLTALWLLAAVPQARAQYYNTGQSPASLRWKSIGNDSLQVVFPDGFGKQAHRTLFYMDTVRSRISYGYPLPPLKTPVMMTTENFFSNGLAMMAPRRIEMGGIPAIDTYSEPWLKQPATHEYRHMVQFGNVNRSTVKVFGYLFGQQAPLLATGLLPFWFIEGDAVMAETQMSSFGRGLQPSFTMHYRALGDEILRSRNPDKWFCGSYKDYVPSHYELGFQLVSYADRRYDEYIGASITRYTSDYPILIFTTQLALNKYYGTSTRQLFRETFSSLNELWDSLPDTGNSPRVVSPPVKIYTTYSHPLYVNDSTLLVLKEDYDRASRFVEIDLHSGQERTVCYTGPVSTRPVFRNGTVVWTEYRQSTVWEQKVDSRLCVMQYGDDRYRQEASFGDGVLYPVLTDDGDLAFVRYHYDGHYSVELHSRERGTLRTHFDESVSLHGLAWDDLTQCFYYIALSDDGMSIGGVDFSGLKGRRFPVTSPAYVTVNNLSAGDGMLYFNSIYSGKDEAHTIDLSTGRQYRISESRYGSFAPSPSPGGEFVALTTYERDGYKTALQEVEYWEEVEWTPVPRNVVNAPLKPWDVPVVDDVVFTEEELNASMEKHPAERYSKAGHLFNLHSWAPLYYSPDRLMENSTLDAQFGATLISQNLLGTTEASLGYGYTLDGHSTVRGRFAYYGWAPKIEVTALWSDHPHQTINTASSPFYTSYYKGNSFDLSVRAYLPLLLSSGYRIRSLVPTLQFNLDNTEIITPEGQSNRASLVLASVQYNEYVRKARLDLQPRWGYTLRASTVSNPFSKLFATAWSVYGRVYTPGLFLHHGLTLAAAYQRTTDVFPMINVIDFQPRGYDQIATTSYFAASADYLFPVAYPDWGVSGVFFLKRISLDLSFQYARYLEPEYFIDLTGTAGNGLQKRGVPRHIYTFGGAVSLDIAPFRMPAESTCTLTVGVYKPRDKKVFVTCGFSVPL